MSLTPITVQLSNFQQIEILRDQIEQFEEDLKKTESKIRTAVYEEEKRRYLRSVHPIFQHSPEPEGSRELPEMQRMREALAGALESLKAALANLEAVSGPVPQRQPQVQTQQRPMPTRAPSVLPNAAQTSGLHQSSPNIASPIRRNRFDF